LTYRNGRVADRIENSPVVDLLQFDAASPNADESQHRGGPLVEVLFIAREPFDLLRRAASQLAGSLLLVSIRRSSTGATTMIAAAQEAVESALSLLGASTSQRVLRRHRLHHLFRAALALKALAYDEIWHSKYEDALLSRARDRLNLGCVELRYAAEGTVGLEYLDLSQSCGCQIRTFRAD
jgi:hypothetical protein